MTEASPIITSNLVELTRPGTIGMPIPKTDLKIVDDEGNTLL